MKAIDRLHRDHAILRAKLNILEAGLQMGPETWFVLREVCHTLARQLGDHIRREEMLVAACRGAMKADALAHVTVEHRDEPARLRTINRLFLEKSGRSLDEIRPVLTEAIAGLRHHMDEEEAALFPLLERVLAAREAEATPTPTSPRSGLEEVMTVNRVLRDYPRTKRVFDKLFVNIPYEGCDCLDEVAWRHGMDASELLTKLEHTITACGCARPPAQNHAPTPAGIAT